MFIYCQFDLHLTYLHNVCQEATLVFVKHKGTNEVILTEPKQKYFGVLDCWLVTLAIEILYLY